jgi:hypothetical protein
MYSIACALADGGGKPIFKKKTHLKVGFWWYLQEEITLFHLISKTPKSLKINDITSFLL